MQEGLSAAEAQARICAVRRQRPDREQPHRPGSTSRSPIAHDHAPTKDFVAAIEAIKPTAIIGVSTVGEGLQPARRSRPWPGSTSGRSSSRSRTRPSRRVHRRGGLQVVARAAPSSPAAARSRRSASAARRSCRARATTSTSSPPWRMAVYATQAKRVHRRAVHRRRARRRRAGHAGEARLRAALSAAERHPGDRATCRGARGGGDLRAQPRGRPEAAEHRQPHRIAHVQGGIPPGCLGFR